MIIKRKTPDAVKTFFLGLNNYTNKGVGIHIYNKNGKFIFTLSKADSEQDIPEQQNIFSIIRTDENEKASFLLKTIGNSIKELYQANRNVFDSDIINTIQKYTQNHYFDFWISNTATKYVSPAEKAQLAENKKKAAFERKNISDDDKEILKVRPYALLQTLQREGIINITGEEPNGNEVKVKFEFINQTKHGFKKFNISVSRLDASAGNKSQIFNDFANQKNKSLGTGSKGLIAHLGENGLFNFNDLGNDEKIEYSKNYLLNDLLPRVPDELKMEPEDNTSRGLYFKNKTVTFQPIERENKRVERDMVDFLKYRGISDEKIQSLFDRNNIIIGDFYNSRIVPEYDKKGKLMPNYSYQNAPYFRLTQGWLKPGYKYLNTPYGAERFQIKRTPAGPKPFNYDKKNIGSVDGKYWTDGEQFEPEMAFIHEAIIDGLSSYEILKATNGLVDPNKQRYFSTQGASHMKRFFSKNVGFWTETQEVRGKKVTKSNFIEFRENKYEMDENNLKNYREQLGHKELIYFKVKDDKKPYNFIEGQLKEFNKLFGCKLNIIEVNNRSEIDFDKYNTLTSILIDDENYSDFLDSTKLHIRYNKEKQSYDVHTLYQKETEKPLNDFVKKKIRKQLLDFFKTDHLVFCLDNDHAGLKYVKLFTELERHLGIKASYMIPDDIAKAQPYENYMGMSLSDMMDKYSGFVSKNEFENAYELLDQYIKQKPDIDNNDVLKKYQELKVKDPQQAQKIIERKIQQLRPIQSPDGLKERSKFESKKKLDKGKRNKP